MSSIVPIVVLPLKIVMAKLPTGPSQSAVEKPANLRTDAPNTTFEAMNTLGNAVNVKQQLRWKPKRIRLATVLTINRAFAK